MNSGARLLHSILNPPAPIETGAYSGYYYAFYGDGGFSTDQSFNPFLVTPQPFGNYAFLGEGGYSVDQSFNPILLTPNLSAFQLYDVTLALQVKYDVRLFNKKLGLLKDASNLLVLESSYNAVSKKFPNDSITINADEFVENMTAPQIISVGAYKTFYREYMYSVNNYFFSLGSLKDDLFSGLSAIDISRGLFDATTFINIINQTQYSNEKYIQSLTGFITLTNINQLLLYAVDSDVFGNRVPLYPTDSSSNVINKFMNQPVIFKNNSKADAQNNITMNTSVDKQNNTAYTVITDNSVPGSTSVTDIIYDISNNLETIITTDAFGKIFKTDASFTNTISPTYADVSFSQTPGNYDLQDGFLAGDLIFIPSGMSVLLQTVVDPVVDIDMSIIDLIRNSGLEYEYIIDVSNIAIQKTNIINKILTTPLLIELANLS